MNHRAASVIHHQRHQCNYSALSKFRATGIRRELMDTNLLVCIKSVATSTIILITWDSLRASTVVCKALVALVISILTPRTRPLEPSN